MPFLCAKEILQIQNLEAARGKEIVVMRSDAAHHELLERNFQDHLITCRNDTGGFVPHCVRKA